MRQGPKMSIAGKSCLLSRVSLPLILESGMPHYSMMRWSLRVARVAGIGIYVHATFPLLLAWVGARQFLERHSWRDAWSGVAFILVLFVIVVLHELGHALTARRYGIRTSDITLFPIGGVARLERMPEDPKQELVVALAGPAVNLVLALLIFGVLAGASLLTGLASAMILGSGFLLNLLWVNIFLAAFNLLPAFPMDGGRVLRALLALRMNYVRATNIAARVGQAMALAIGLAGILVTHNPFMVVIAIFVYLGAGQEAMMVQRKSALGKTKVGEVMIREFRVLSAESSLKLAAEQFLAGWQHDFPVIEQGRIVGALNREELLRGLEQHGPEASVGSTMHSRFLSARADEPADAALFRLGKTGRQALPVISDGEVLGILTIENVREYLLVKAALHPKPEWTQWEGALPERRAA